MECRSYQEQMAEYLTGTLEVHRAMALEEHAKGCEECGRELEGYRKMMGALAEPIEVPADFRNQLRRIVIKEAKRQLPTATSLKSLFKNPFFKVLMGATAASLILLMAGLVWFELIMPKQAPETFVSFVEDQTVGMEMVTQRGLSSLVPDQAATASARLLIRYSDAVAGEMDEKAVSVGGTVVNSANKGQPYALYSLSPDVLSFYINYLKTLGPVEANVPRITSITSDAVYLIIDIGK